VPARLLDAVSSGKTAGKRKFSQEDRHAFCIPLHPKMNGNQVIRPEIEPIVNGGQGGNPNLVKIRRKLGLTYVLSNPFRVSVTQPPARPDASEKEAAKTAKKK
jgi:hypothetical protein